MSFTLCTEQEAIDAAGEGASATATGDSVLLANWADAAEGRIEVETKRTWVANFSSLSTPVKGILQDVCASMVAMKIVSFNTTDYFSTREAELLMDYLDDVVKKGLKLLENFNQVVLKSAA
jgi:hypothetical protein